jgi:large subunit ribosomal protein L5
LTNNFIPRMKKVYFEEAQKLLIDDFGYVNDLAVPKIQKISINMGLGEAVTNNKAMESSIIDITKISGQKPMITRAKKAISNFKIRQGNAIGLMVTLRGDRMWNFYDRLVNIALPRTRDFRGVSSNSFDGHGNYSLGIREHIIFPDIDIQHVDRVRGFQVNIITSAKTDEESKKLLELLNMPFDRKGS